ncbi:MAG TPA: hypothetical protein VGK71_07865 [Nitrospirota bacterium]
MSLFRTVIYSTVLLIMLSVPAFAAGPAPTAANANKVGRVEGKVVYKELPVEGAQVFAYSEPVGLFNKEPAVKPFITGADGAFSIELPKGQFYIAAAKRLKDGKGQLAPGDLYSFYGANPMVVDPARPVRLTLNMVEKPEQKADSPSGDDKCAIEGTVTVYGQPMDGVVVFVYLDPNSAFRGLGYYMTPPTGVDGQFKMRMNEGTYYLVARKRMNRELSGPLHDGDFFGYLDVNPVVMHSGKLVHLEIPVVKKIERASPGGQGRTLAAGVIKDKDGKPAQGMYACLYKNESMTDRPFIISKPTGSDGRYAIELPIGGTYYLGARSVIGGPMEPGQFFGRYGGSADHSVTVDTGKGYDGLDITVDKIPE